jgi:hypothetical protein
MSVGWINDIYNNTIHRWLIKSIDKEHNGKLEGDRSGSITLDDGLWAGLDSNMHYSATWCGIPWYDGGKHYKAIALEHVRSEIIFYQSQIGEINWVIFEEGGTGRSVGRMQVSKSADYNCVLRIETTGIFLDVVNAYGGTQDVQLWDATKGWVDATMPELAKRLADVIGGPA